MMFNFIKSFKSKTKNKNDNNNELLTKTASLLIHAAKIDENYTKNEKIIIEKTLVELGANSEKLNDIMEHAEKNEEDSNQILDFTKDIKNTDQKFKIKLIKTLWKIIYSDKSSDIYESNLMRRLAGLLYLDNKLVGDIKEKIKENLNK